MAIRRDDMVDRQIRSRGILDAHVLAAMRDVPREAFVPAQLAEFAYDDTPLPIAAGQTISQPYIVAMMIAAAEVAPGQRVLDVGTGSGYAAAILSRIAAHVYSIERLPELAENAEKALNDLGYDNVDVRIGDGTLGWPEAAPFDAILVAAGGPDIPEALLEQLSEGGRLVMPVGERHRYQKLIRVRKAADAYVREELGVAVEHLGVPRVHLGVVRSHQQGVRRGEGGEHVHVPRLLAGQPLQNRNRGAAEEAPQMESQLVLVPLGVLLLDQIGGQAQAGAVGDEVAAGQLDVGHHHRHLEPVAELVRDPLVERPVVRIAAVHEDHLAAGLHHRHGPV
ncbi:MAG: protein-L-isoaspartate(D-aspartate) O-methyltransferase, partial [Alphaproteobacteria bacterium]|nr:protein-L-isoaspartate(D-aspartate) O-methyltransferase [Alphaproteobacteria bacterium]